MKELHLHPRTPVRAAEDLAHALGHEITVEDGRARLVAPEPDRYLLEADRSGAGSGPVYRAWRLEGGRPRPLANGGVLAGVLAAVRADIEAGAAREVAP